MAVTIGGRTGGDAPNNLIKIFKLFLTLPNCAIKCKITGNVLIEELDMDQKFRSAMDLAEKGVKKLLTVWKKELRIIPSNNLREII